MRTTIDIPDDLMRRAKAKAALTGTSLKDLFTMILKEALQVTDPEIAAESQPKGQGRPVPVSISLGGGQVRSMTNAEIEEMFVREDIKRWKLD